MGGNPDCMSSGWISSLKTNQRKYTLTQLPEGSTTKWQSLTQLRVNYVWASTPPPPGPLASHVVFTTYNLTTSNRCCDAVYPGGATSLLPTPSSVLSRVRLGSPKFRCRYVILEFGHTLQQRKQGREHGESRHVVTPYSHCGE